MTASRPWPDEYIATVGVFDGVHLGHQMILTLLSDAAAEMGLPTLVVTFHPRPVTVFAPDTPPDELTPLSRKIRLLTELGAGRVMVLPFSEEFARIEPERFLAEVLGAGNGLRALWVGYDFRFGHNRRGNWEMLERQGPRLGFIPHRVPAVTRDGQIVSSTRIRAMIRAGDVEGAAHLLGRRPDIEGKVVEGRGAGRRLLVATANLALPRELCLPARGVYAGEAEWDGVFRPAVMNLGLRPTLTEGFDLLPEVHILDWDGDLRGKRLLFRLRNRLREERKFPSLNALRDAIEADIAEVRRLAIGWTEPQ